MADFIGAVDQGTTSTRFMIFDHDGREVARHQLEHEQILPRAGWVEHNPIEIWERTRAVIGSAMTKANLGMTDLAAIGVTNQRETTIVWDRRTGRPLHNAIVWQDTRTDAIAAALDRPGNDGTRPGDTIRLEARALDKFIRKDRLFVVHDNVFFNQHNQVICSGRGQTIRPM